MSNIVFTKQTSAPLTPTSNKVRVYVGSDGNLRSLDQDGNITIYAAGVTPEEVQDIVASFLVAGNGISINYDDPNSVLSISSTITQYTNEMALDAIGEALANSESIDFVYNDETGTIMATVNNNGVNHNELLNYVENQHIDHGSISIITSTGLSGGGNLTLSRTLSIADTGVSAGSYGNAGSVSSIVVNAQGQVTSASQIPIQISTNQISNFVVSPDNVLFVAKNGNDSTGTGDVHNPYLTIYKALSTITDSSENNIYQVKIAPGIYSEQELIVPDFTMITGESIFSVVVQPDSINHHIFTLGTRNELSFMTLKNAGSGYAAINATDCGYYVQCHKVSIQESDTNILAKATSVDSYMYLEYVDLNGVATSMIEVISENGFVSFVNFENGYTYPTELGGPQILIDGSGASMDYLAGGMIGVGTDNAIQITNTGEFTCQSVYFENSTNGIYADTAGISPNIEMTGCTFKDCTNNLNIANTTATGYFTGYSEYSKNIINSSNDFFIVNKDPKIITVGNKGSDFTSIAEACDSIIDASATNLYIIEVGPGEYTEPEINVPDYVAIKGPAIYIANIYPDTADHHVFNLGIGSEISFMTIYDAGSGYAAINVEDVGAYAQCHKISIEDCDIGILVKSNTSESNFFGEYVDINNSMTTAVKVLSQNDFLCYSNFENFYVFPTTESISLIDISGTTTQVTMLAGVIEGTGTQTAVSIENGAFCGIEAITIEAVDTAIHVKNVGSAPDININATLLSETSDVLIEHPGTTGAIRGSADKDKVFVDSDSTVGMSYTSSGNAGQVILNNLFQGSQHDRLIDFSKLVREGAMVGLVSGGEITQGSGRYINVAAGNGFLIDPSDQFLKEVSWDAGSIEIPADSERWVYIDTNETIQIASSKPDTQQTVSLGRVVSDTSELCFISFMPTNMVHQGNENEEMLRYTLGPIYGTGSIVSEVGSATRKLAVTAGLYYYGTNQVNPSGSSSIKFEEYYRDGSTSWIRAEDQETVSNVKYDDGSGTLADLTTDYYAKHSLYTVADGDNEKYFFIYSQTEYDTLVAAQEGNIPTPPTTISKSVCLIATIIMQKNSASITQITDERPRIGFKPSAISSVTAHGDLTGLSADDHTQYLLVSGTRAMTGNLQMGSQNITGVNLVDGVDVSSHESRHLPNGSDPLTTAAPSTNLSTISTNDVGIANSLARSDHSHAITFPTATQVSGFDEAAQDAVGTILTDTASVDLSYGDGAPSITATVLPAGVDHNSLNNYSANRHIDHSAVSISPGTGLSGGGDLTTTRTLTLANTAVTPATYGSATQVPVVAIDQQGRITSASNTSISIPSTQVSDFNEAAQDAVGGILTDTSSIDLTYTDESNQISATVLPAGVDHNSLNNYSANRHIDHTAVSISAGTGLSGGGDISATRTISMPNVGTAGTYGSSSQVPVFTTDAQGRISSVTNTTISTPVSNTEVSATATTTTTSGSDVLISGMTITPAAGTYLCFFSTTLGTSSGSVRNLYVSLYNDGVQVDHTERRLDTYSAYRIPVATQGLVTVTGTEAIEVRWRCSGGTTSSYDRTFNIIKVS